MEKRKLDNDVRPPTAPLIKVNTFSDRLNFALALGGVTGMTAVVATTASMSPVLWGGSLLGAAGIPLARAALDILCETPRFAGARMKTSQHDYLQDAANRFALRLSGGRKKTPYVSAHPELDRDVSGYVYVTNRIVVSAGALRKLSPAEQEVLLAHEVGHVKARHVLSGNLVSITAHLPGLMMLASESARFLKVPFGMASVETALSGVALSCGYFAAGFLIESKYHRQCEYQADRIAAQLTSPRDMALILKRCDKEDKTEGIKASPHPYSLGRLLAAHPPLAKRIERLQKMPWLS